jgi:uncharacterized protein (TIRG00374 family)
LLAKIVLVATILTLVFRQLDLKRAGEVVRNAALLPIVGAVLLFLCNRVLTAIKWDLLLRKNGIHAGIPRLIRAMFVSSFLGIILPSGLGADLIRLVQIGKENRKLTESASSVLADRMLAIVALSILSCIAAVIAIPLINDAAVIYAVLAIAAILTLIILGIMGPFSLPLYNHLEKGLRELLMLCHLDKKRHITALLEKANHTITRIHNSFRSLFRSPVLFSQVLVMNLLVQAVRILQIYALFTALHCTVPWVVLVAFVPMIILLTLLPVSPFLGIGVKEGAFVYLFSQIGVAAEISFSVSILSHLVLLIGLIPGAILAMSEKAPDNLTDASSLSEKGS